MEQAKKLKRGLKDISPLFQGSQRHSEDSLGNRVSPNREPEGIECLSVFHPDRRWSSLFMSGYLASQIGTNHCPCTVVSLGSRYTHNIPDAGALLQKEFSGRQVRWVSFNWDHLQYLWRSSSSDSLQKASRSERYFIDFDYTHAVHFGKIMPMLDKWILLVRPDTESLMEAYKALKAAIPLNQHMEYYFLIDGVVSSSVSGIIYERFSEIVSRYLGVSLNWLGSVQDTLESPSVSSKIALENLCIEKMPEHQSVEKRMLAGLLQGSLKYGETDLRL